MTPSSAACGQISLPPSGFPATGERAQIIAPTSKVIWRRFSDLNELTCYLQDLSTDLSTRRRGVGRALIEGVYKEAKAAGIQRVYWQTHTTNAAGRLLYDKVAKHIGFIVYSQDV